MWPRYVEALFKRKFMILGSAAGVAATSLAGDDCVAQTIRIGSQTDDPSGRESVALDPTATTSQTLMLQKTQEEEVNSALDLLRSRRIAERTVDKLGAENINRRCPSQQADPSSSTRCPSLCNPWLLCPQDDFHHLLYATGIKEDLSERELAIMELTKHLEITAERRSAVVSIEAFSKTPEMAQAIAQTVGEEFISEYLEVTHNAGSYAFFSGQAQEANETRSDAGRHQE